MPEHPDAETVKTALRSVVHPDYDKPLVELGLVRDIAFDGKRLTFSVTLNAPVERVQRALMEQIDAALDAADLSDAQVTWKLEVPMRPQSQDDPVPKVRNVIGVLSGKGGVGKSTCAVNLALAMRRAGARVGILDADIYGPSIPTMLGVMGHPRAVDKSIEPLERFGVKLMSIGFMLDNQRDAIIWRGPMLQGALMQFLTDVTWGELDYLVIDLPPGTGDVALSLTQRLKMTGVVMVTTPQEIALQDVYKAVSMCKKLNLPVLGVLENMSYFIDPAGLRHELFGAGGGEKIAQFADAPLIGQVPLQPQVRECADAGTPIVQQAPEHPVSQVFVEIADRLTTLIAINSFKRGGGERAPDTSGQRRLKIIR